MLFLTYRPTGGILGPGVEGPPGLQCKVSKTFYENTLTTLDFIRVRIQTLS